MRCIAFKLVLTSFFLGASATAQAQPILDREFLIGPRVGVSTVIWDVATDQTEVPAPHISLGVDLRKELSGYVMRASSEIQFTPDGEEGGITFDFGPDFYLGEGRTAPYLGALVGMRVGGGPYRYTSFALGFGGGARFGVMFNRQSQTRFFFEATGVIHYMSYNQDSIGTPTPPDFTRTEVAAMGGVLF